MLINTTYEESQIIFFRDYDNVKCNIYDTIKVRVFEF